MQAVRPAPRIPEPRRNALKPSYAPRIAFQTDARHPPRPYDTRNRANSATLAARNASDDKSIYRDATRCPRGVFERIPNSAFPRNKTPRWQEGNQNLTNGEAAYIVPHVRMESAKGKETSTSDINCQKNRPPERKGLIILLAVLGGADNPRQLSLPRLLHANCSHFLHPHPCMGMDNG